jgi:hypothetical protein
MNENIVNLPKSARLDRSLSNNERERLLRAARLRDKVAKTAAAERSAVLLADFEQQLASVYSFDQSEIWAQAYQAAKKAIDTASRAVAGLGIPKRFAPDIGGGPMVRPRRKHGQGTACRAAQGRTDAHRGDRKARPQRA